MSKRIVCVLVVSLLSSHADAFTLLPEQLWSSASNEASPSSLLAAEEASISESPLLNPLVAGKFKVLTCSSTSCAAARKKLNQDEFSTFSAFYTRIEDRAPSVQVEESPCLGSCKQAPCVGIEHEDFEGPVSLEGMTESEFSERVFHRVVFEEDADRVWGAVENAIRVMAEQEEEDDTEEEGQAGVEI